MMTTRYQVLCIGIMLVVQTRPMQTIAPNLNGYNSESESESSIPGLIDRAVSDSSDDSDTGSVNYALLHPPRHLFGAGAQPPALMHQRGFFV